MSFSPPMLDVRSPLLETGLADDRFHVTDYVGDGAYPDHRAEKDKAERYVAYVVAAMDRGDATQLPTTAPIPARDVSGRTSSTWRAPTLISSSARSGSPPSNEASTMPSIGARACQWVRKGSPVRVRRGL
jgi:hypothetical protein